jgi:hypothetical protein
LSIQAHADSSLPQTIIPNEIVRHRYTGGRIGDEILEVDTIVTGDWEARPESRVVGWSAMRSGNLVIATKAVL